MGDFRFPITVTMQFSSLKSAMWSVENAFSGFCRDGVIDKEELKILLQSTNLGTETISMHPVSPATCMAFVLWDTQADSCMRPSCGYCTMPQASVYKPCTVCVISHSTQVSCHIMS